MQTSGYSQLLLLESFQASMYRWRQHLRRFYLHTPGSCVCVCVRVGCLLSLHSSPCCQLSSCTPASPLLMNTSHFLLSHSQACYCSHHKGGCARTGRPPSCPHLLPANPLRCLHCLASPPLLTSSPASSWRLPVLPADTKHNAVNVKHS